MPGWMGLPLLLVDREGRVKSAAERPLIIGWVVAAVPSRSRIDDLIHTTRWCLSIQVNVRQARCGLKGRLRERQNPDTVGLLQSLCALERMNAGLLDGFLLVLR